MSAKGPEPYDHVRPGEAALEAEYEPGVYRVVGVDTVGRNFVESRVTFSRSPVRIQPGECHDVTQSYVRQYESGQVTLLRVGDENGRRTTTGTVVHVEADQFEQFEAAENPDSNRSLGRALQLAPRTVYWSVIAFGQQLVNRPVRATVLLALFLGGWLGGRAGAVPEPASTVAVLVGGFGLALLGSGRV